MQAVIRRGTENETRRNARNPVSDDWDPE